jgi:hypothetical protein
VAHDHQRRTVRPRRRRLCLHVRLGDERPIHPRRILANFVPTSDPARIATAHDNHARERLLALAEQYDPVGTLAAPGQLGRVR